MLVPSFAAGGTCNAYGSISGCAIGQTCASPPDCIRTDAEFRGYDGPPAKAVVLFIFIALVLMSSFVCCLWCCFSVWDKRRMAKLKHRIEQRKAQQQAAAGAASAAATRGGRDVQLSSLPVSAAFRGPSSNDPSVSSSIPRATVTVTTVKKKRSGAPGDLQESLLDEGKTSSDAANSAADSADASGRRYAVRLNAQGEAEVTLVQDPELSPTSAFVASAPITFPPPLPPLSRKGALLRSAAKGGLVMALLATVVVLIVACLMYPHVPSYSMCNKDIQWGSILTNMQNLALTVDVDLHVAVWNPNRFHMQINHVAARILYVQDVVGTGSFSDIGFPPGSIKDFILTVAFAPSATSAVNMLRDHLKGQLLLDVLFDIDTSILLKGFASPLVQLNTTYVYEQIDAEGEPQREFCKCQDPDVSATLQPRIGSRVQRSNAAVMRPKMRLETRLALEPEEVDAATPLHSSSQQQQQPEQSART